MTKKKKHKFKIGDNVTFKFFDGGVYTGVVDKLSYMGEITGTPKTKPMSELQAAIQKQKDFINHKSK